MVEEVIVQDNHVDEVKGMERSRKTLEMLINHNLTSRNPQLALYFQPKRSWNSSYLGEIVEFELPIKRIRMKVRYN